MSISDSDRTGPYCALAPLYDRVMRHVDYDGWADFVERVLHRFLPGTTGSILEIGGGTGMLGSRLAQRGYRYTGCDYTPAMCREANAKGLRFFAADARYLPVHARFDRVLFLYDGINYLLSSEEYRDLFTGVSRCLTTGGIFLFDITTAANSRRNFRNLLDSEDLGDAFYTRHSYFQEHTALQINDFTIFRRTNGHNGTYRKYRERHVQKVLRPAEIAAMVPRRLFHIHGMWDGYTMRRHTGRSERVHFCLCRENDR